MAKEIKCPECGKVFERRNSSHKYCCIECRKKATARELTKHLYYQCGFCGIGFEEGSENPYCSDECKRKAEGKPPKAKRKKVLSIDEVARLAKKEGLTYGQYVVKYGGNTSGNKSM